MIHQQTAAQPYRGLALLTDLDGTLLTPEKTVSPADAAAIRDFREKGGLFGIATGRGLQASQMFLELLQPDFPAVLYNGALLYDAAAQKAAFAARLPKGIGALLTELMQAFPDVGAEVLDEHGVYVIQDGEYERRHLEITHIPVVLRQLYTEINPENCLKALFAGSPEDIAKMLDYVREERFSVVNFTRSHKWFLEILPHDTNKGTAMQRLRGMLPAGTVIGATGDFDNDSAMLRGSDFCGCPADSQPGVIAAVRESGGFVSEKTCENGFFADWIAAFLSSVRRRGTDDVKAGICEGIPGAQEEKPMIEQAECRDLEEILRLQYLAYQSEAELFGSRDIPPLRQTLDEVTEEFRKGMILKLVFGGKIIGSVRAMEENGTVYIGKLMVYPDYRCRGYGSMLLRAMEDCYPHQRYELFTSTRSTDNIRLYQKMGYREFARKAVNEELIFVYMEKC